MDNFVSVLTAVLAVTTILGVALAGLQRGVVTNLRESNTDLRASRDDLTQERDKLKALSERQSADIAALGRVVTGEAHLVALGDRLDEHHEEAKVYWHASTEQGQQIIDALRRLSGGPTNG